MQKEITSVNNDIIKNAVKLHQKKYRDEKKLFLLEGYKAIEEAINSNIDIESLFVLKNIANKYSSLKDKVILTNEIVLKKISTTDSPPDAVAVAKQKIFTMDDLKDANKVILLENIKDSGNLGTILRTAKAFSQDAVVLYGDTVDLYNPKCVRSAVGNLWKSPVVQIKDFAVLSQIFENYERVATLPKAEDTIFLQDYRAKEPYLIMFGSEADGLSDELIKFSTKKVTIKMNNAVESLNLGVSVGVVLSRI